MKNIMTREELNEKTTTGALKGVGHNMSPQETQSNVLGKTKSGKAVYNDIHNVEHNSDYSNPSRIPRCRAGWPCFGI